MVPQQPPRDRSAVEGLGKLVNVIAEGPPVIAGFGAMPSQSDAVRGVALGTGLVN